MSTFVSVGAKKSENQKASDIDRMIQLAAKGIATVLITGPTGSGKTFLARQIHEKSQRSKKPFVAVNLATLHEGTFESELFGHERGAFTGADSKRVGKLEAAQGGTVFLDEVGELPPRLQARLLEFLQSRIVTPVGSNRDIRLDVRIIAATNRNLAKAVAEGSFREDLFHRLRVIAIPLRSLNERFDEFGDLVHTTLSEVCRSQGKSILRLTESVATRLESHDWPGNLRELHNVLEFAVQAAEGSEIQVSHLPAWFAEAPTDALACAESMLNREIIEQIAREMNHEAAVALFEKTYLLTSLQRHRWRISTTARQIGMNKTTLLRRIKAYSLINTPS